MKYILILFMVLLASRVEAQFKTVISNQLIQDADERQARRKAIDEATDAVTIEMVRNEIGPERYRENKSKIENEVKPLKNRFIPFFKILSSQKEGESFRFSIEVKFSPNDLKQVLQQKGLFASVEKNGITLPFIEFNNQMTGESFRWWSPVFSTAKDLENVALTFEEELFEGFLDKGLFLLRPQAFNMDHMIPPFMRKTYLNQTEMIQLTHFKKGQLYIDGRMDIFASPLRQNAFRIRVQLSCKQTANGKSVAEVVKTLDSGSGQLLSQIRSDIRTLAQDSGEDLASQVYDLWQRGALEAQVIQLVVTGNLNHQQILQFKKLLSEKIGLADGLTERLFEPNRITFEMDYNGEVEKLKKQLSQARFTGFQAQILESQGDQIMMEVRSL